MHVPDVLIVGGGDGGLLVGDVVGGLEGAVGEATAGEGGAGAPAGVGGGGLISMASSLLTG